MVRVMLSIWELEIAACKGDIRKLSKKHLQKYRPNALDQTYEASISLCKKLKYEGAGTIEFLYEMVNSTSLK